MTIRGADLLSADLKDLGLGLGNLASLSRWWHCKKYAARHPGAQRLDRWSSMDLGSVCSRCSHMHTFSPAQSNCVQGCWSCSSRRCARQLVGHRLRGTEAVQGTHSQCSHSPLPQAESKCVDCCCSPSSRRCDHNKWEGISGRIHSHSCSLQCMHSQCNCIPSLSPAPRK